METAKAVLSLLGLTALDLRAVLTALLAAWGLTQAGKPLLVRACHRRVLPWATRVTAFGVGFVVVLVQVQSTTGVVLGVVVGAWAPVSWKLAMLVVGRYKPEWRAALSGDRRDGNVRVE